jgi:glucose/mannose-6-phosphate isomerase
MLLDNHIHFQELDPQNLAAEIDAFPDQLSAGWDLGQQRPLPKLVSVKEIIIAATGDSAIAAALLETYAAQTCSMPIRLVPGYNLPASARGPETLVIALSHTGNDEETLAAVDAAIQAGCTLITISTDGKLAQVIATHWGYEHSGQPNFTLGMQFGLLLALFARLDGIPLTGADVDETVTKLKSVRVALHPEVDAVKNPAKRTAGQAAGRFITVYGADYLIPVARRWAAQINLLAKSGATFAFIPEADHNRLAGTDNPTQVMLHTHHIFLRAQSDHPRNRERLELTRQAFMLEALSTDTADARGKTPLTQMLTMLLFGDYVAYYLAMIYGVNPAMRDAIDALKTRLRREK